MYSVEPAEADTTAYATFFDPVAGIVEDPATGTEAGPLASLLNQYAVTGDAVMIAQGDPYGGRRGWR